MECDVVVVDLVKTWVLFSWFFFRSCGGSSEVVKSGVVVKFSVVVVKSSIVAEL